MLASPCRISLFALICLGALTAIQPGFAQAPATDEWTATLAARKARDVARSRAYETGASSLLVPGCSLTGDEQPAGACLLPDTDDDGMADAWETDHGLDPDDPDDAWLDPDRDHAVNLFEFQLDADPHSAATPPIATVAPAGADFVDVGVAIDTVAPGTAIRVAGGTYPVNYITFDVRVVMIQGGWSPDFTQRDLQLFPTTFDGQSSSEILYFSTRSGDPVVIVDGIRLVRGDGFFGALNLLAQGTSCMRTSVVNCSITESASVEFGGVFWMNNWDFSSADRTVANTLIVDNPLRGIYSQIVDCGLARWRILHTSISRNGDNGEGIWVFTLFEAFLSAHLYNSIVWGNQFTDIRISGNITVDADHSDIGIVATSGGAVMNEGAGVVDVDPLFVDPAGGDYRLQLASSVIDAGTTPGIPLTDFEGNPRSSGAAPDMGAYEVSVGTSYCTADPNSTGVPGRLIAVGSTNAAEEDLALRASDLPPGNVCLFLASVNQGFFQPPRACGPICLMGPDIARFKFDAQVVDEAGDCVLQIDPFVVLTNPPQPILNGQTWNFQAWHRDTAAGPDCNNNFTDAVEVSFAP